MILISNHIKDGSVDWYSYDSAMIAAGEMCSECGRLTHKQVGRPSKCGKCEKHKSASV